VARAIPPNRRAALGPAVARAAPAREGAPVGATRACRPARSHRSTARAPCSFSATPRMAPVAAIPPRPPDPRRARLPTSSSATRRSRISSAADATRRGSTRPRARIPRSGAARARTVLTAAARRAPRRIRWTACTPPTSSVPSGSRSRRAAGAIRTRPRTGRTATPAEASTSPVRATILRSGACASAASSGDRA
jgi:hypothetical protein